ncbi:hypothetical protein Tco_0731731 [Tanacetum coccineum]
MSTIQPDSSSQRPGISTSGHKMGNVLPLSHLEDEAAYYPDVGLEQMVPDQIWIEEECKYDVAAMYGTVRTLYAYLKCRSEMKSPQCMGRHISDKYGVQMIMRFNEILKKSSVIEDGKPVAAYVIQMKGYADQLERLGYVLPQEIIVVGELHAMLIEYEKGLPKKAETPQIMMIKGDLVKERFGTTMPTYDKEKELWVKLERLFELDNDDTLWKLQRWFNSEKLVDLDDNHKFRGGLLGFKPITLVLQGKSFITAHLVNTARVEDSNASKKV